MKNISFPSRMTIIVHENSDVAETFDTVRSKFIPRVVFLNRSPLFSAYPSSDASSISASGLYRTP